MVIVFVVPIFVEVVVAIVAFVLVFVASVFWLLLLFICVKKFGFVNLYETAGGT